MARSRSRTRRSAPARVVRGAVRGAAAGVVGTLAMDALWYSRYRRAGGEGAFADWELSSGIESWERAPAPAQVAKLMLEGLTGRAVPVERAAALNTVMHWTYGTFWGAQYGALVAGARGRRAAWHGVALGAVVWGSDYVVLPLLGVYEPIWRYDRATLAKDLSAHEVYGVATDLAVRALGVATPG